MSTALSSEMCSNSPEKPSKSQELQENRRRVRYWAALSLLRCLMSSPDAAVAAFLEREKKLSIAIEEVDLQATEELRQRELLDPLGESVILDSIPDAAVELGSADLPHTDRLKLRAFRQRAEAIKSSGKDPKIQKATQIISDMVAKGFHPIVYCRFIATANYVAAQLQQRLRQRFPEVHVTAATSETGDDGEREALIEGLALSEKRVLVATDCLSEGINLQEHFDAVLHYDLPWNPNRLEQRDGRVDRFGQKRSEVRTVVLFSPDNPIDRIVLKVLVQKVREIYNSLGIRVSFATNTESVAQALVDSVLQSKTKNIEQLGFEFLESDTAKQFMLGLELDAKREEESRTRFAQHAIEPDVVDKELKATDSVLGDPNAVRSFVLDAGQRLGLRLTDRGRYFSLDPESVRLELRQKLAWNKPVKVVFDSPPPQDLDDALVLGRNHPLVAHLSDQILGRALQRQGQFEGYRCGAAYTNAVKSRTVILLLRVRYILSRRGRADQFAEELVTTGYDSGTAEPHWFAPNQQEVLALLETAEPAGNITSQEKEQRLQLALNETRASDTKLLEIAEQRATELETAYDRLKQQIGGATVKAEAHAPDILGLYVLLPGGQA